MKLLTFTLAICMMVSFADAKSRVGRADSHGGGHSGGHYSGGNHGGYHGGGNYHGGYQGSHGGHYGGHYNHGYHNGYSVSYSHHDPYYYGHTDCFIATAAYGTPLSSSVQTLRTFRDTHMRGSIFGDWFIKNYETYSPPIADFIAHNYVLRLVVALLLAPLIFMAWVWMKSQLLFFVLIGFGLYAVRTWKRWRGIVLPGKSEAMVA